MAPVLRITVALHAIAVAATVLEPSLWRWTLGAVVANHLLLVALSLLPRNSWLGPNLTRLPPAAIARGEIALTIDDGPDPDVTPKVLDILDARGAKATFFCVGTNVARHPDLARDIVRRGHAIGNHSGRHGWDFALSGVGGFVREIDDAQRAIVSATGVAPAFFRAPAGMRNPFLDTALARTGLRLASWTRRGFDAVERDAAVVLARLTRGLAAGDILLMHDGHAARTDDGTPVIIAALPALLDAIEAKGLRSVTLAEAVVPGSREGGDRDTPGHAAGTRRLRSALAQEASEHYRRAGLFARHFARGKLGGDPVYMAILERGLVPDSARVLDLGCGQGLLAAWLLAANARNERGQWPAALPRPPRMAAYTGIELMASDAERARKASGIVAEIIEGDVRAVPFTAADVAVLLDVLHYLPRADQQAVLERVRDALPASRGTLVLRVGDAAAGARFGLSRWVDRVVAFVRGHRFPALNGRPLVEWLSMLHALGFSVEAMPMSAGTPFANVLLVARLAGEDRSRIC